MASAFHPRGRRKPFSTITMDEQNDVVMGGDEQEMPVEAPVEEAAPEAAPETGEEEAA